MQPRDKVRGQERAIPGHADQPFDDRRVRRGPVETGENARQRSGIIGHAVGHDRQPGVGELGRLAVGAENELPALRAEPRYDAVQNGGPADADARLVAAACAARSPASKN